MVILKPGHVRWDGFKYVLEPAVETVGLVGPQGPAGPSGSSVLFDILQNRRQNLLTAPATYVDGGDDIVSPVTLVMVASGKIRISANVGYQLEDGSAAPIISASIGGGYIANIWTCQQQEASSSPNIQTSIVFEYDTHASPGQIIKIFFSTRVGDQRIGIFTNGVGDAAASLLVEELP